MAEDQESRTEPATPRRREEARQQGRVPFSAELGASLGLLAGVVLLTALGPGVGRGLIDVLRSDLPAPCVREMGTEEARDLMSRQFTRGLGLLGVFLGVLVVAAVAANVLQVGFRLAPERLSLNTERLSPAEGMKKIFSTGAAVKGGLAILKVTALALLAWLLLRGRTGLIVGLSQGSASYAAAQGWSLTMRLALGITAALAVLGALDYAYQRFDFERSMRMTRQEVKEEVKRDEGDPLIKARVRKVQREMARRRMFAAVAKASVVLTNPTHVAVALRYERGVMTAPRLLAKGAGFLAERIKSEARRYGIPVIERPPLARMLFKVVKLDQEIPAWLFQAVAEVLAYLYRLRNVA
jgi:flagellar biosynthetic protein FlhB